MRRPTLRVLLVEDDADIAAGLGAYLGAHGLVVDYAYSAAQARERVRNAMFDVFVLDVNLPGGDGIALCRELKFERALTPPAIFLTARGALDDKLAGFAAGGADWMVKPFAPAELLARIRALTMHQAARDAAVTLHAGDYAFDVGGALLRFRDRSLRLHASGVVILHQLMPVAPAAVSRQALAAGLWGEDAPDSDPLRVHVYQLRQALHAAFGTRPIVTARGIGYRFEAEA
jgi:DNA-binding response OmpR family regulator